MCEIIKIVIFHKKAPCLEQEINLHINVITKTCGTDCEIDVFI